MFEFDEKKNIHINRGDVCNFLIGAKLKASGDSYTFRKGDVVRFQIMEKGNSKNILVEKDFEVAEDTEKVQISLDSKDTRLGDPINKPAYYWYAIRINPETKPQTIIGYNKDDGAREFVLYPEGSEV